MDRDFKLHITLKYVLAIFKTAISGFINLRGRKFIKPDSIPSVFANRGSTSRWKERVTNNSTASSCKHVKSPLCESTTHMVQSCTAGLPNPGDDNLLASLNARIEFLEGELRREQTKSDIYLKERDHVRGVLNTTVLKLDKEKENTTFSIKQFKNNDSDVCYYTGFPTYNAMEECFNLLNPVNNILYLRHGKERIPTSQTLSHMDQFFLVLVRLRLGLLVRDLAQRFSISTTSVNRYFTAWINYMYLRLGSINIWPSKQYITSTMPESMKDKYPNLEWRIDAFEMQTQRPASLLLQSQSYSSYKSRNTVKGLVACTPSGQVGFISQLYTGNISDRELTVRSGFLNMPHNKGAMWLVDKGFQIADLAQPLGVTVNMPCFVGNRKQMTAEEVFHTQSVVSERIHIERCINKIKKFHYFDRPISLATFGSVNQAWLVCAMLTLFQNPIISA